MLPRRERLTTPQFGRAFAQAQVVRHPLVVVKAHFRGDGEPHARAAFVVPKKQGKANERNRVRRRLRERYRLHPYRGQLVGCDLIFLATPQTAAASLTELDVAIEEVLKRATRKLGAEHRSFSSLQREETTEGSAEIALATEAENLSASPSGFMPLAFLALGAIRFYQRFISPGLPPSCRFEPTCSRYTYAAIERFGLGRGLVLGVGRVCRCHPWHPGGDDPVPELFPDPLQLKRRNPFKIKKRDSLSQRHPFVPKSRP